MRFAQSNREKFTNDFQLRNMYKKQQAEEYLQRVMKASMATPTDSAVAMAFAGFTTDNSPALSKIDKPTVIAAASKELMPTFQDMQKRIPGSKSKHSTMQDTRSLLMTPEKFDILLEEFIYNLEVVHTMAGGAKRTERALSLAEGFEVFFHAPEKRTRAM